MKIKTTRFGEIEVSEKFIFDFSEPIIGYEKEKQFALIEHKENSAFRWLQAVDFPEVAFVVTVPGFFGIDYSFELPETTQETLGIKEAEDILSLNIVVIPRENPRKSTVNLLAPIIINIKNNKAGQIVLNSNDFPVDFPLFEKEAVC
ncbi:MAG TPA: flagellar assembly protein FliW [Candidatus Gastranaerophilaceae bacterium]|nr:flagellar assembly protein FliW [Candidatus Gastranaerophilaceae bacterium]HPT41843.1 flagellar assembly protein FliW [Candidatus Gastranaerophilaceae bacterium]